MRTKLSDKNKKTPKKKTDAKKTGSTHATLNAQYRKAGEKIGKRASLDSLRHKKYIKTLNVKKMMTLSTKSFGGSYRTLRPRHDELLATSSARELMKGASGNASSSAKTWTNINTFFTEQSELRFPTKWSGFSSSTGTMQHPTSEGQGIWDPKAKGNSSIHYKMDLERKQEVFNSLNEELNRGSNLETISKAGRRRAISYTLNEFTAPATASDQRPASHVSLNERIQQVEAREELKRKFVEMGGKQETSRNHSMSRPWGNRKGKRSVSPPRRRPSLAKK